MQLITGSRALNFGEFRNGKAQQHVPKSLAPHEDELSDLAERCHVMCMNVLKLLAIGLRVCNHSQFFSVINVRLTFKPDFITRRRQGMVLCPS
jgi:hypothetical protein